MAAAGLERLRELVLSQPALEERLAGIEGWDAFVAASQAVAEELGLEVGRGDLEGAREEGRRAWLERWPPG